LCLSRPTWGVHFHRPSQSRRWLSHQRPIPPPPSRTAPAVLVCVHPVELAKSPLSVPIPWQHLAGLPMHDSAVLHSHPSPTHPWPHPGRVRFIVKHATHLIIIPPRSCNVVATCKWFPPCPVGLTQLHTLLLSRALFKHTLDAPSCADECIYTFKTYPNAPVGSVFRTTTFFSLVSWGVICIKRRWRIFQFPFLPPLCKYTVQFLCFRFCHCGMNCSETATLPSVANADLFSSTHFDPSSFTFIFIACKKSARFKDLVVHFWEFLHCYRGS